MRIFVDSGNMQQSAHIGWQNNDLAFLGLREGYKRSGDELIGIANLLASLLVILMTLKLWTLSFFQYYFHTVIVWNYL